MDATPISFETAIPLVTGFPLAEPEIVDATARKWTALHDAAFVVATLAGVDPSPPAPELRAFPRLVREAPHWRRELSEQGVEDLAAIMEPGLAALIAVHTGGGDPTAPALALWHEFTTARDALVAMALPLD